MKEEIINDFEYETKQETILTTATNLIISSPLSSSSTTTPANTYSNINIININHSNNNILTTTSSLVSSSSSTTTTIITTPVTTINNKINSTHTSITNSSISSISSPSSTTLSSLSNSNSLTTILNNNNNNNNNKSNNNNNLNGVNIMSATTNTQTIVTAATQTASTCTTTTSLSTTNTSSTTIPTTITNSSSSLINSNSNSNSNNSNVHSIMCKVRAQVMIRDDSTGGWVPIKGGGLSSVVLIRKNDTNDCIIVGKRIIDQQIVLWCPVRRHLVYNEVMPTFHHWATAEARYGLTFVTAKEAKSFEKNLKDCCRDLLFYDDQEDDIFVSLDLPAAPPSPPNYNEDKINSETGSSSYVQFSSKEKPQSQQLQQQQQQLQQNQHKHDYSYPTINLEESRNNSLACIGKVKDKSETRPKPLLPTRKKTKEMNNRNSIINNNNNINNNNMSGTGAVATNGAQLYQCKHCLEYFTPISDSLCEFNSSTSFLSCIQATTCIGCASCVLYHCSQEDQDSGGLDIIESDFHCCCVCLEKRSTRRRCLILTFLTIFVPCLLCFPPLRSFQRRKFCCLRRARHEPL